jgi:hypothetical protein
VSKHCYIVDGTSLFVAYDDGYNDRIGTGWEKAKALGAMDHRLFAIYGEALLEVDPGSGKETTISRHWGSRSPMLAASGGRILVGVGSKIYEAMLDGENRTVGADFAGLTHLAATKGRFFAAEDGRIQEIDPDAGTWRVVGERWDSLFAFTAVAGTGYVLQNDGDLYSVDLDSGAYERICSGWYDAGALLPGEDCLFVLDSTVLYCVGFDGRHTTASSGWNHVVAWGGQG